MAQLKLNPDGGLLPARAVWERYGVTSMSLHRWISEPSLAFPAPVYIGRFRYWRLSDLLAWEASRPRKGAAYSDRPKSEHSSAAVA